MLKFATGRFSVSSPYLLLILEESDADTLLYFMLSIHNVRLSFSIQSPLNQLSTENTEVASLHFLAAVALPRSQPILLKSTPEVFKLK